MLLYNVKNAGDLFNALDQCRGEVYFKTPDGNTYNWHKDGKFFRSLTTALPQASLRQVELDVHDALDRNHLFDYLMEEAC